MNPSELMIGNLAHPISRSGEIHMPITPVVLQVTGIGLFESECIKQGERVAQSEPIKIRTNDLSPIPLTEEWLLKFGFETGDTGKTFSFDGFLLMKGIDGYVAIDCNLRYALKYVHQLQNLYFCLCGKEIEINQATPTIA